MHIHSLTVIGQRRLIHRWIGLIEMNHILLIYSHQTDALPLFCLAFLTKKHGKFKQISLKIVGFEKIINKYIFPRQFAEANSVMCLPTGGPK